MLSFWAKRSPARRRASRRHHTSSEVLEVRTLPAVVTATLAGNVLTLTGDADPNTLTLSQVGGKLRVEGSGGTQITFGSSTATQIDFRIPHRVVANLQGGDDKVTVNGQGLFPRLVSLEANLGNGNNQIDLNDLALPGSVVVNTGTGNDTVNATNSRFTSFTANTNAGNDTVKLNNTQVAGHVQINTAAGIDTVEVTKASGWSTILGRLGIDTGADGDTVTISGVTVFGQLSIATQAGIDTVQIGVTPGAETRIQGGVNIQTGTDADTVRVLNTRFAGSFHVATSTGADLVQIGAAGTTTTFLGHVHIDTGADVDAVVVQNARFHGFTRFVDPAGTGGNSVAIDDSRFYGAVEIQLQSAGDKIDIERDLTLTGSTEFTGAIAFLVTGPSAVVQIGVSGNAAQKTTFRGRLFVKGGSPAASVLAATAGTTFLIPPRLIDAVLTNV